MRKNKRITEILEWIKDRASNFGDELLEKNVKDYIEEFKAKKIIFEKDYSGFESSYDIERDVSEAFDKDFNDNIKEIPEEFRGTITITIEYEEE